MNKVKLDENLWIKYDFPPPLFFKEKDPPKLLFLPSQEVFVFLFLFFFYKNKNKNKTNNFPLFKIIVPHSMSFISIKYELYFCFKFISLN
jgi:hypothetical protein